MAVLWAYPLVQSLWFAVRIFTFAVVVIFFLNGDRGKSAPLSGPAISAPNDATGFFYTGGIYNSWSMFLLSRLDSDSPAWDFRLLDYVPGPAGFVIYWMIADCLGYWIHRWYHHNPDPVGVPQGPPRPDRTDLRHVLAQSSGRADRLECPDVRAADGAGPAALVLGAAHCAAIRVRGNAALRSQMALRQALSDLRQSGFHPIHHSPDRARHDSNYGKILSVWDYLFGTMSVGERPARYGVAGVDMPVSFWGTTAEPFISLWRKRQTASRSTAERRERSV